MIIRTKYRGSLSGLKFIVSFGNIKEEKHYLKWSGTSKPDFIRETSYSFYIELSNNIILMFEKILIERKSKYKIEICREIWLELVKDFGFIDISS